MGHDPNPFMSAFFMGITLLLLSMFIMLFYNLLTDNYNPILSYFCIPVIIVMILGFTIYACIIYPLQNKKYLHDVGYRRCAIYGLCVIMFGENIYAKIVLPLTAIALISEIIFYFI